MLAFDEPRRILFVAAESGPLTTLFETDTGLKLLAQRDVGPNALAVAVDPNTPAGQGTGINGVQVFLEDPRSGRDRYR